MSTGTAIIQDAMKKIGAHSLVDPATTEGLIDGLSVMNSMLQLWQSQGIKFEFIPITTPGEELFEPIDTRNAIVNNLAIEMSPLFDNGDDIVSPRLKALADSDYEWVKTLYQVIIIPNKVASSLLPRGAGNSKGVFRRVFNGIDGTVGN